MNRSRLLETIVSNRCLLLTLAVALAVRLVLALAVQQIVDKSPGQLCLIPGGDADGYWELAQTIVAGRDYAIYDPPRYVLRVPGFPLVLAVSQAVFGPSPLAARCLLALIGTAACGLTYWLGCELADSTTGFIAALYTALSPTLAVFSVLLLSETTFAAALLISLVALARLRGSLSLSRGLTWSVMSGLLIGVATLVRPTWLYAGLAIGLAVLLVGRSSLASAKPGDRPATTVPLIVCVAGLVCGLGISLVPWTVRNFFVTGHLVPTTLWVGPSLYDGLNPTATGDSDMRFIEQEKLQSTLSEYEVDREYRRRAVEYAFRNPGSTAWLAVKKQQRYWSLVPNASQFRDVRLQLVVGVTVAPLFVLAAWAAWCSRRNLRLLLLTASPILLFAALHLLFVGSLRYRLPAEYALAVLAAVGFRQLSGTKPA